MKQLVTIVALCISFFSVSCHWRGNAPGTTVATAQREKTASAAEIEAGNWQIGSLTCGPKDCTVKVKISPQNLCHAGDLDFIDADISKFSVEKAALLSLEALSPPGDGPFEPVTRKVPLSELDAGVTYELSFPRRNTAAQLGLFLCKDSEKAKHCLGKRFLDGTKLVALDFGNGRKTPNFRSPDTIYFFQYLFVDGQTISTFLDMTEKGLSDEIFDQRLEFVLARLGPSGTESAKAGLLTAKSISRVARSMPLELNTGGIGILLPKQAPGCRPAAR